MICLFRAACVRWALTAALLASTVFAEETETDPVTFPHEEVAPNLIMISCRAGDETYRAHGVIVDMDGIAYLLTSLSNLLGADEIFFTTGAGDKVIPRRVELSNSRDLARLELATEQPGLALSPEAKMNTPVALFTREEGEKQTVEQGRIIGVGAEKIEISASFDKASSGMPVFNASREVVGIAAYSREFSHHAMKTGTRFDREARHFCYRVGRNDWRPVNWRALNGKYGLKYRRIDAFCERIITLLNQGEDFNATAAKAEELASECRIHAREIRLLTKQPKDLTDFLLNDLEQKAEMLEYVNGLFLEYAKRRG